ncbi:MAG: AAA family ATPase [Planctomycetaceae bacterium]|nr:AAA family ATPase [Planctomycetaceae bacterium]
MSPNLRQFDPRKFQVLPENRLALAAVQKLSPKSRRTGIPIVTVVAPSGYGKSLLARQLFQSWQGDQQASRIHFLTGSQFAAKLADASSRNIVRQFQKKYRQDTKLLICEDLQTLERRNETQRQLIAVIDDITGNGGRVMFTTTKMPNEIPGFSRKLANRIQGGICVGIEPLSIPSRRKLLKGFFEAESLHVPSQTLDTLAKKFDVSPRELAGLVAQICSEGIAPSDLREGTFPSPIEFRLPGNGITLSEIARVTAREFGVTVEELRGESRTQRISQARQAAMALARELLNLNYVEIGEYFRRNNHSTVIHACRKVANQLESDIALEHHLGTIRRELQKKG